VNYDKRAHDKLIESDKFIALAALKKMQDFVSLQETNNPLTLEFGHELDANRYTKVDSNFQRELLYTIEHAVHHMAIIKIGLREVAPTIVLPTEFGVAASTLRHQENILAASH